MSSLGTEAERTLIGKGVLLCLAAMLLFASQDAVTKMLVQEMSVAQVVLVRYWVFAVFAIVWVSRASSVRRALRSVRPKLQVLRSLLSIAEIAIFNLALRYLGLAESHSLMAVFPLMAIALAAPILGERVSLKCWFAVCAGFIGTLVILRPGLDVFKPESLIPLSAALCFAGYHVVTRQVSSAGDGFNTNILYMALVGCVCATLFGLTVWREPSPQEWVMLAVISVLSVAAQILLVKALEYAPASVLQPFNYSLLVFATIIGFLVFSELPDFWTIVGAGIVIVSGLYVIILQRARR
ncbi:EamA/RhaT family transporter [Marinomonas piezotolerans]|uniref:EamA/RhaT family transporter n=1 Tax=Marinomonas piezotolerans TaxID=2213058 RepID=A0A370UBX3_9GAMM|nr:DMT family transporter [Marinomonas piezotolerans]RDL45307.1 EamA/RhaT family transporter [Marinomonas piezotolerans]